MQALIHQQMNIISAAVLLFFILYSYNVLDRKLKLNRQYLISLTLNMLLIILDSIFVYLSDKVSTPLVYIAEIIRIFLSINIPYLTFIFLKIVCNYFPKPFKIKYSIHSIFYMLIIINAVLAFFPLLSIKGFYEYVKIIENTIPLLISFVFAIFSVFVVIKSKKMIMKFEFISIFSVALIANAFLLAQLITDDIASIWCGNTIILIFMFVIIQQRELYRDSLTGARNRGALKKCVDTRTKKVNGNLTAIMIDLDYFKSINDCFGHSEGDYALKAFVKILQRVFSENGVVIRMGGDEFLVLLNNVSSLELNDMIRKMTRMIDNFNRKSEKPYRIRFSYASGTYDNNISIEDFIHDLDMKMYQNKKISREQIWSVENL